MESAGLIVRELSGPAAWRSWQEEQDAAGLRALERRLSRDGRPFDVTGICFYCDREVPFRVEWTYSYEVEGRLAPNWREHLLCPRCHLNNRMRAVIHLASWARLSPSQDLYVTESVTPLAVALESRYPSLETSEFLSDGTARGQRNAAGVRHEDLTDLTFGDASFDGLLSFDVLEHIPDYEAALRECFRVLRPGGVLLLTAPYRPDLEEHHVLAVRQDDGVVRHLHEPEYHADPVTGEGCLCFRHYSWQLLDELSSIGFVEPRVLAYWSREFGYLGHNGLIVKATRPASGATREHQQ